MAGRFLVIPRRLVLVGALGVALGAAVFIWRALAVASSLMAPVAVEPSYVLIDPGHGGIDGGAATAGVLEKDITLAVALRLRAELISRQVPVALTRELDADLGGAASPGRHRRDLAERLRQATQPGVRFLVSLHANSAQRPSQSGILILFPKGSAASQWLAQQFQSGLAGLETRVQPPIPRTNLLLLRQSPVPAVMIEMGFLTNQADRIRLQSAAYQAQLAAAMAVVIQEAYVNVDSDGS